MRVEHVNLLQDVGGMDLQHFLRPETEDRTSRQDRKKKLKVHRTFNLEMMGLDRV